MNDVVVLDSLSLCLFLSLVLYINLFSLLSLLIVVQLLLASLHTFPSPSNKENGEFVHVCLSISSPPSLFHSLFLSFPPSHLSLPLPLLVSLSSFLSPSLPLSPLALFLSPAICSSPWYCTLTYFSLLSLLIVVQLLLANLHTVLSPSSKNNILNWWVCVCTSVFSPTPHLSLSLTVSFTPNIYRYIHYVYFLSLYM